MSLGKITSAALAMAGLILPITIPASAAEYAPPQAQREFVITTEQDTHFLVVETIKARGGTVLASSLDTRLVRAKMSASLAETLDRLTGVTVGANQEYSISGTITKPSNPMLDRIDQRQYPGDNRYAYADKQLGSGVNIYVVDSGVQGAHPQFTKRVENGVSFVNTLSVNGSGPGNIDCDGHGTHVAGIAAGATVGVAPKAKIIPVRIFGCANDAPADTYRVLTAIDWIIDHHKAGVPAVVNMSIGSEADPLMAERVDELVADGITVVTAAGNDSSDACRFSPANAPAAITVAAMSNGTGVEKVSSFSNYGSCVDIFAPGGDFDMIANRPIDAIRSANASVLTPRSGADSGLFLEMSGTSQAAPFVAGAAARYLSFNPKATPEEVTQVILSTATPDFLTDSKGSPNRLLYVDPTGYRATPTLLPTAPLSVRATATSDSSVVIQWKAPTNAATAKITGYTVTATSRGLAPVTSLADAKATSLRLDGLQTGRSYRFTVTATSAEGDSPRSLASNPVFVGQPVAQPVAARPEAPTNLVASPRANAVNLTWNAPAADGGSPILVYLIEVSPQFGVYEHSIQATGEPTNSFEFWGLNKDVEYTFTVYTVTAAGISPTGATVSATPSGNRVELPPAPSNVRVTYNKGFLTVQWPYYVPKEGQRGVSAWQISLIDDRTGKPVEQYDVQSSPHLAVDFSKAQVGKRYRVAVTVKSGPLIGNTMQTGAFTMSKKVAFGSIGTPGADGEKSPSIPGLEITLKALLNGKDLTITWDPPKGKKVLRYEISWQDFNNPSAPYSEKIVLSGTSRKAVIKTLPAGVWMLRIESVTTEGIGSVLMKIEKKQ